MLGLTTDLPDLERMKLWMFHDWRSGWTGHFAWAMSTYRGSECWRGE